MPTRYASHNVRQKMQTRIDGMQAVKGNQVAFDALQNKDRFNAELEKQQATLTALTPPDTPADKRKDLDSRLQTLERAMVHGSDEVPGMPSQYDMEKVPVGLEDREVRWNLYWQTHTLDSDGKPVRINPKDRANPGRGAIEEWKDLRRMRYRSEEGEMPNAANIEHFRPSGRAELADVRLPVSYGMPRRGYEEAFPDHEPTDVELKVQQAEARQKKRQRRDAQSERMKQRWARKRAEQAAAAPTA